MLNTRNCRHIQVAKKKLEWINISTSFDQASIEMASTIYTSVNVTQKAISHLFISSSEWYRLSMNKNDISRVSFQAERNLLSRFILNNNSWCSYDEIKLSSAANDFKLTIHTSFEVINKIIEINYYILCHNIKDEIDLDLSKYDIFNWNNKITFSHELIHLYISQFITSETSIYAFHQIIRMGLSYRIISYRIFFFQFDSTCARYYRARIEYISCMI